MPATAVVTHTIEEVADRLRAFASSFDPRVEPASDLAHVVEVAAEVERLAAGVRLQAAARVADSGVWKIGGDRSADEWMARLTHTTIGQARSELGTGARLASMGRTAEAVRAGRLSPQQANEVTSAVYFAPDAEARLLDVAERQSLRDLKDAARAARQATSDDAARHERIRRNRSLRTTTDAEGAFLLTMRGPASDGAQLLAALRPFHAGHFDHNRRTANHIPYEATAFDAMCTMAQAAHDRLPDWITQPARPTTAAATPAVELWPADERPSRPPGPARPPSDELGKASTSLAFPSDTPIDSSHERSPAADADGPQSSPSRSGHGPPTEAQPSRSSPGHPPDRGERPNHDRPPRLDTPSPTNSPPAGDEPAMRPPTLDPPARPRPRLGGRDTKVIVRIDHTALLRGHAIDGETVDIAGVGPIPVAAVRELMPDAIVAAVVTKGRDVATVAHLGRGPSRHQHTALQWLMPTCTVAGCPCTVAIEYDHRRPWVEVFETALDNLDGLCSHHHWLKTHQGHVLEPGAGERRMLPPHHPDHPKNRGRR